MTKEREKIKTTFTMDDLNSPDTFSPCNECSYLENYPVCDDGATSSACNHCKYNILSNFYYDLLDKINKL